MKGEEMETQEKATMVCKVCGKKRSRRHRYCPTCAKKAILDSRRKWRRKVKKEVMTHYSTNDPICNWGGCGETDIEKLCLDHVNGGGRKHMKRMRLYNKKTKKIQSGHPFYIWLRKRKYPNNPPLQVLCRRHNQEKQRLKKEY